MDSTPGGGTAQPILTPMTRSAIFLVLTVETGGEDIVRDLLADVPALQRSVGFRVPDAGLTAVVGIGAELWPRLYSVPPPPGLHPFRELNGPRHRAPATPGDLLLHLRAQTKDLAFELATQIMNRLRGAVRIVDEVHGFKYFDMRNLLGFVDGTENPVAAEAVEAAITGDEDPYGPGGSYVIVQKYLHDLPGWNALPVHLQERVFGRTKLSDIEMADKPADAHITLNVVVDSQGRERAIVRENMPFGRLDDEFGTYFIGYAADPVVTETMLERMFFGAGGATHDAMLNFSTAVTGGLFYVPTIEFLQDPPLEVPAPEPQVVTIPADGSLSIGSLKGQF